MRQLATVFAVLFLMACASEQPETYAQPSPGSTQDSGTGGTGGTASGGTGGASACSPKTCTQLGANCGVAPDTCGGSTACGDCPTGTVCGAKGPNLCGSGSCAPKTCVQLGASCGVVSDSCAAVVSCGTCPSGESCVMSQTSSYCADGAGGSGGVAGSGGVGGTGGAACDPSDFCELNGYSSDWHCDGDLRVLCSVAGTCNEVTDTQNCGSVGCSNGACNNPCGTTCTGHCGVYQGCDCGGCGTSQTCSSNVCELDCGSLCAGRCGSYQGCSCAGCTGSDVCDSNTCVDCINGDTESRSCDPGMFCPPGTETRVCSSHTWGTYQSCTAAASAYRFYGDGGEHCADDFDNHGVLCIQVVSSGSNYDPEVRVSKTGGGTFDNDVEVRVLQPGTANVQHFGCQPIAGFNAVIVHLDPSMFDLSLGDTLALSAEVTSPCYGTYEAWSDQGYLSQCKP